MEQFQLDFVKTFTPLALGLEKEKGIPALFALSQWAHESDWGRSTLASVYHNLGGVKFLEWQESYGAKSVSMQTWEYRPENTQYADFAAFPDFQSYVNMYGALLTFPRYVGALQVKEDIRAYAEAIWKGGYATDPAYVDKIMGVVQTLRGAFEEEKGLYREPPTSTIPQVDYAFADIPANHWALQEWETAVKHGLMRGDPNGQLRPDDQMTRSEVVVFGVRLAEYIYGRIKELIENGT